jgi:hypothetical protein
VIGLWLNNRGEQLLGIVAISTLLSIWGIAIALLIRDLYQWLT